jgi:pimeloyl-ACP methyl ester carboxylesterase
MTFETAPNFYITADAYGDPENPVVIFLHGGGQTRHSWGDSCAYLAQKGYYCLALDARGHGDSSWSATADYSGDALKSDLLAILTQLNTKPALVGASMGGITAMLAEGESATSVASALVLVDIAPKPEQKGIERIFAFMSANMESGFGSLEEAAEAVAAYLPHRAKSENNSRLEKNLRLRDGRWYWHWDPTMLRQWQTSSPDQRIQHETRLYNAARHLKCQTLLVRGGMSDVVSEKVMVEFLDEVPHVRSVSVTGAGHMVAGDSNHSFTKAVLTFLEEVYPPK